MPRLQSVRFLEILSGCIRAAIIFMDRTRCQVSGFLPLVDNADCPRSEEIQSGPQCLALVVTPGPMASLELITSPAPIPGKTKAYLWSPHLTGRVLFTHSSLVGRGALTLPQPVCVHCFTQEACFLYEMLTLSVTKLPNKITQARLCNWIFSLQCKL